MFRFTIRELVLLTLVAILSVLLWLGHRRELFRSPDIRLEQAYPARTEFYSTTLNEAYVIRIKENDICASPRWDRRFHDPPLSASDAIALADAARKRLIKQGKIAQNSDDPNWVISRCELTPYDLSRGLWYWVIVFETGLESSGPPSDLYLAVLMNGVVVEPTEHRGFRKRN